MTNFIILVSGLLITFFLIFVFSIKVYIKAFALTKKKKNLLILIGSGLAILILIFNFFPKIVKIQYLQENNFGPLLGSILSGVMFYIFLSSILIFILFCFAFIFRFKNKIKLIKNISLGIFILTIFIAGLGFWQAGKLKITTYNISFKNLPTDLIGEKFILIADTHFGKLIKKNRADELVNKILEINPKFVIHAGDFYDGPMIDLQPIKESWKKLSNKIPIFYTPGNHERYGDYEKFIQSLKDININVLENQNTNFAGINISGIDFIEKKNINLAKNVLADLKNKKDENNFSTNTLNILINHHPTFLDEIKNQNFNLLLSGHTHKGQFWPLNYIVRLVYGKYYYGYNEYQDLKIITTSGTGFSGVPTRLFNTPEIVVVNFVK